MEERKKIQLERIQDQRESQSFGEYLKRERELREISLREIADDTKISFRYLQALEEDNTARLPAEVFIKGFIRSYAQYIGLDPDEAILRYQEFKRTQEHPKEAPRFVLEESKASSWLRNKNLWMALLGALALAGVLVYAQALKEKTPLSAPQDRFQAGFEKPAPAVEDRENDPKAEPLREQVGTETEENSEEQPAADAEVLAGGNRVEEPKELPPPPPPADIVLAAVERTWLSVAVDEKEPKEFILEVGAEVRLQVNESMRLDIGNAGGLVIRSGAKTLGPFGKSGRVKKDYVVTRKDLEAQ
jgi:cytoskeletal protein RodZ